MSEKQSGAEGWLEYYRRLLEAENKLVRIRVPDGISHVILMDGTSLLVPPDRIISVSQADAAALGARGWERLMD
jgi:hypothetical protein